MRSIIVASAIAFSLSFVASATAQELLAELSSGRHNDNGELFGCSCSAVPDVDGDGVPDFVVGAYDTVTGAGVTGRAYVISGATFKTLYSVDGAHDGDRFGYTVTGSPDVDGDGFGDFLVGAITVDVGGKQEAGRAYLYSGKSGALIRSHDGKQSSGWLGSTLASIGDLDGDGTPDYLIGAPRQVASSGVGQGRVYACSGATGALLFAVEGQTSGQEFGRSLATVGDVDGDGIDDFAVGSADSASGGGSGRGRVDLFSGRTSATLFSLVGQPPYDASLGISLAGRADFDGDGVPDLVVGDSSNSKNGAFSGAAFIYSGATASLLGEWEGANAGDGFGFAVAVLADANGDGRPDLLAGSLTDTEATATLISGGTGHELYQFRSGKSGDYYATVVCNAEDLTGDGISDLAIGAPDDSTDGSETGRAYVYAGNELFLEVSPSAPAAGATLDLAWHCREPSVLTLLALVDVGTAPAFTILDFGPADGLGERSLAASVPPGLAGLDVGLQAFAADSRLGTVASSVERLRFQ